MFSSFHYLLMFEGAIPANKCKSSTYVGLSHPARAQHAIFSSESSMYGYVDLAYTEVA